MKKYIYIFLLSFTTFNLTAQNIYYDVEKLLAKYNPADSSVNCGEDILNVLGAYVENPTKDKIILEFENNPFFYISGCTESSLEIKSFQGMIKNLGGMSVEKYADGLAKFLVQRTKEELNVAFFQKFSDELLNTEKYGPIDKLFPKTYNALKIIGDEIYQNQTYILMLRECFNSDIKHLDENLIEFMNSILDHPKYKEYFDKNPNLKGTIVCSAFITHSLINNTHPGEIIKGLPGDEFKNEDIKSSISLLKIFSESVKSKSESSYWVEKDSIRLLLENPAKRNLFLGLIYQKSKNVKFKNGKTFGNYLDTATDLVTVGNKLKNIMVNMASSMDGIKNNLKEMKTDVTNEAYDYNWHTYIYNITSILKQTNEITNILDIENKSTEELNKFLLFAEQANDLYNNVKTKNYSSALLNVITILDSTLAGSKFEYKSFLLKYGAFMINVIESEGSDQVKNAIEAIALPSGSASIKKYSPLSVSLNAFVGIYPWGQEYLANNNTKSTSKIFGVTAPIGIAISHGGKFLKRNWSITAYGSIIDVGAFVSYRFKDTTSAALPEVKLQNIFAPGCGLIIGLPNLPISIGGMWQAGPMLREIDPSSVRLTNDMNYRWTAFIAVDIPLLNFYAKPRK